MIPRLAGDTSPAYDPKRALCDGPQALSPEKFTRLMNEIRAIARIVGR